jgi:hypothetical protein
LINYALMLACLDISLLSTKMYGDWTVFIKCRVKPYDGGIIKIRGLRRGDEWTYHYNKRCFFMLNDFTRFWMNSLV